MTWRIAGPEWTWWSKATSIPVQQPLERSASTVVPQKFWWSLVMKFTSLRLGGWRFQPICKNIVKLDHGSLSRDKTTFYRKPPPRFIHLNSWIFKCKLFSKHTHNMYIKIIKTLKFHIMPPWKEYLWTKMRDSPLNPKFDGAPYLCWLQEGVHNRLK